MIIRESAGSHVTHHRCSTEVRFFFSFLLVVLSIPFHIPSTQKAPSTRSAQRNKGKLRVHHIRQNSYVGTELTEGYSRLNNGPANIAMPWYQDSMNRLLYAKRGFADVIKGRGLNTRRFLEYPVGVKANLVT